MNSVWFGFTCECGRKIECSVSDYHGAVVVRCPNCGRYHQVRVDVSIVDITKYIELLDEFEEWLRREKKLSSAYEYRKMIERFLLENKFPRVFSPIDYFKEFLGRRNIHPGIFSLL